MEIVYPDLLCDRLRRFGIVPGHHHDTADPAVVERIDGTGGILPQRIKNADHGGKGTGDAEIQMRILGRQCIESGLLTRRDHAALVLKDKVCAPDDDLMPIDGTGYAMRDDVFHTGMILRVGQSAPLCLLDHSVCHGVRVMLLQTSRQTEHILCGMTAERYDVHHGRIGIGERTRFVEHDRIRLCRRFKKPTALYGDVVCTAFPHRKKECNLHGELQVA